MANTVEFLDQIDDLTLDSESVKYLTDLTALGFTIIPAQGETPPKLALAKKAETNKKLRCRKEVDQHGNSKHIFLLDTGVEIIDFFTQYQLKNGYSYVAVDDKDFKKAVELCKHADEIAKTGKVATKRFSQDELANVLVAFQQA